ncbi:hypothetical protein ACIP2X_19300 [Streptomyces sp. NPDC089424]|uniref:hypothetical protein n=1 Tax=Streptomyces sp. NPDC089424 TaxID=3365917 RepID=UPI0037FA29AF
MAKGTCKVPECGTVGRLARGWCLACYEWSRSHNWADPAGRRRRNLPADGECTVVEGGVKCTGDNYGNLLCRKHYDRQRRHGDPLAFKRLGHGEMQAFLRAAAHAETSECVIPPHRTGHWNVNTSDGFMNASRYVWILRYGDPGRQHVLHTCNGGSGANGCVNIRHLTLGDNSRNVLDRGDAGVQVGEAHHSSKLRAEQVTGIRERAAAGKSYQALADEYGVCRQTVSDVVARRTWRRLP